MSDGPNSQGSDITEWKKVQQKLLNGELAVDIIEAIPDGVVMVDMDGKMTFINKAFEKILGYNGNQIDGQE
jgi:PAS domain-containing protein